MCLSTRNLLLQIILAGARERDRVGAKFCCGWLYDDDDNSGCNGGDEDGSSVSVTAVARKMIYMWFKAQTHNNNNKNNSHTFNSFNVIVAC